MQVMRDADGICGQDPNCRAFCLHALSSAVATQGPASGGDLGASGMSRTRCYRFSSGFQHAFNAASRFRLALKATTSLGSICITWSASPLLGGVEMEGCEISGQAVDHGSIFTFQKSVLRTRSFIRLHPTGVCSSHRPLPIKWMDEKVCRMLKAVQVDQANRLRANLDERSFTTRSRWSFCIPDDQSRKQSHKRDEMRVVTTPLNAVFLMKTKVASPSDPR